MNLSTSSNTIIPVHSNAEYNQISKTTFNRKPLVDKLWNDFDFYAKPSENENKQEVKIMKSCIEPKKIIFNPPATIVIWTDNTKTVVKADKDTQFNEYYGLCAAYTKKIVGNNSKINKLLKSAERTYKKGE